MGTVGEALGDRECLMQLSCAFHLLVVAIIDQGFVRNVDPWVTVIKKPSGLHH